MPDGAALVTNGKRVGGIVENPGVVVGVVGILRGKVHRRSEKLGRYRIRRRIRNAAPNGIRTRKRHIEVRVQRRRVRGVSVGSPRSVREVVLVNVFEKDVLRNDGDRFREVIAGSGKRSDLRGGIPKCRIVPLPFRGVVGVQADSQGPSSAVGDHIAVRLVRRRAARSVRVDGIGSRRGSGHSRKERGTASVVRGFRHDGRRYRWVRTVHECSGRRGGGSRIRLDETRAVSGRGSRRGEISRYRRGLRNRGNRSNLEKRSRTLSSAGFGPRIIHRSHERRIRIVGGERRFQSGRPQHESEGSSRESGRGYPEFFGIEFEFGEIGLPGGVIRIERNLSDVSARQRDAGTVYEYQRSRKGVSLVVRNVVPWGISGNRAL